MMYQSTDGAQVIDIIQYTDRNSIRKMEEAGMRIGLADNKLFVDGRQVKKGQYLIDTGWTTIVKDSIPPHFKPAQVQHELV